MSRKESRENAFLVLFQMETAEPISMNDAKNFIIEDKDDFMVEIAQGVKEHEESLDNAIKPHLKQWTLERLPKADRIILRIAVYEMTYTDVPKKVAINEAVDLAKTYSDDSSYKFVNGVLSEIVKDLA